MERDNVVSIINLNRVTLQGTVNKFQVQLEANTETPGKVEGIPHDIEGEQEIISVDKDNISITNP